MTCLKCQAPLQKPAKGRPPVYCGPGCRRAAEYELRRLQRHLEGAETERQKWSHNAQGPPIFDGRLSFAQAQLERWTAEVERLEVRLRELLGAGDE